MNSLINLLSSLYAKCVRGYPTDFRLEFEEEMCQVFTTAIREARERHFLAFLAFVFREFIDLPKNLMEEYWALLGESIFGTTLQKAQEAPANRTGQNSRSHWMNEMDKQGDLHLSSKGQRILASLPLFLFGLGISLTSLIYDWTWYSVPRWQLILSFAIGLLPMAVIAVMGLIALIRRIPDWGLTWVGTAFMGLVVFVKTLAEELADAGQRIVSEPFEIGLVILLFMAGVALLVMVGMRGWHRGGLLSIGFSVTFTLTFLWALMAAPFYLDEMAVWAGPIGFIVAGMTYVYTNANELTRFIILVSVGIANFASILLANTMWHDRFPIKGETFSPIAFILFMLAFLICGPIIGLITGPIRQMLRQA